MHAGKRFELGVLPVIDRGQNISRGRETTFYPEPGDHFLSVAGRPLFIRSRGYCFWPRILGAFPCETNDTVDHWALLSVTVGVRALKGVIDLEACA